MLNFRQRFELSGTKDGDREVVTRTFKTLRFEPHPRRRILVIRGEIEISVAGIPYGDVIEDNTQEFRKLIKLEGLSSDTNLRSVTEEVLEQCPFIPEDLIPQVVTVLEVLRTRKYDRSGVATLTLDGEKRPVPMFPEYFDDDDHAYNDGNMKDVKMDSLELYIELLYEELQDKIKGARSLWKLTNSSENLVTIFNHDTAINAIFRTLREDYRKSIEFTSILLNVIFAFTKFEDFHPTLTLNKVIPVTLDVIDFELARYEKWMGELYNRKELAEDPETATQKHKSDLEKMQFKFTELTRKQDPLLAAAFDIIRHMLESGSCLKELKARGFIRQLMMTLERSNVRLLTVAISFLAMLSCHDDALEDMIDMKIVEQTIRILDETTPRDLLLHLVTLYYNLSFSTKLRFKMIRHGVLNKFTVLFEDADFEGNCILTMYNISIDFKVRSKFTSVDIIPKLIAKIVTSGSGYQLETSALLLNLAGSKKCAMVMCANNRLTRLVKVAIQRQDPLVMKIIRKISSHQGPTQVLFTELITNIVASIREKSHPEYVIECLGTLSNLSSLPDVDYCELLQGYQLLKYIRSVLTRAPPKIRAHAGEERSVHEALLLEVVVFLGACGTEPSCSDFFVQEGILDLMLDLGRTPALDTDIRLHLLYAVYRMSTHTKTRNHMIEKTNMSELVQGFIRSECTELRDVAQAIWAVFGEYNDSWRDKVRSQRFMAHNEHWIEICDRSTQISMDRATLNQFHARLNAEKNLTRPYVVRKRVSAKSSDSYEESDEDSEEESEEEEEAGESGQVGRVSVQSEDIDGSESDQSRSRSIFDQFRHQFNKEMVSQIYNDINSEEDEGETRASRTINGHAKIRNSSEEERDTPSRMRSSSASRPATSKSRPATAHHGGRLAGSSGILARNTSTPVIRTSFDGQSQNEPHPAKGMRPPIIVNITPKESW